MDCKIEIFTYENGRWVTTPYANKLCEALGVYTVSAAVHRLRSIPQYADVKYGNIRSIPDPGPSYTALEFVSQDQFMQFCMEYL